MYGDWDKSSTGCGGSSEVRAGSCLPPSTRQAGLLDDWLGIRGLVHRSRQQRGQSPARSADAIPRHGNWKTFMDQGAVQLPPLTLHRSLTSCLLAICRVREAVGRHSGAGITFVVGNPRGHATFAFRPVSQPPSLMKMPTISGF